MIKNITCRQCGAVFQAYHSRKFCNSCKLARKRAYDRSYHLRNRDKRREQQRLRYWADPVKAREQKRLRRLANLEHYRALNRASDKRCSERRRAYRLAHRLQENLRNKQRYWLYHDAFLDKKKRYMQLFYSKHQCRIRILRKLRAIDNGVNVKPFCQLCGKTFKPHYPGEKYCSDACRRQSPLWRIWLRIQARFNY